MVPPAAFLGLLLLKKGIAYVILSRYGFHRIYRRALEAARDSGLPKAETKMLSSALKSAIRYPPKAAEELSKPVVSSALGVVARASKLPAALSLVVGDLVKALGRTRR